MFNLGIKFLGKEKSKEKDLKLSFWPPDIPKFLPPEEERASVIQEERPILSKEKSAISPEKEKNSLLSSKTPLKIKTEKTFSQKEKIEEDLKDIHLSSHAKGGENKKVFEKEEKKLPPQISNLVVTAALPKIAVEKLPIINTLNLNEKRFLTKDFSASVVQNNENLQSGQSFSDQRETSTEGRVLSKEENKESLQKEEEVSQNKERINSLEKKNQTELSPEIRHTADKEEEDDDFWEMPKISNKN